VILLVKCGDGQELRNILMWTMQIMGDDEQYHQHITTRKIGKKWEENIGNRID